MKLSNFIALCALSFSAVSGVAEAKFAPTSFVGKKQKTPSNDVSQLNEALLSSRGGSASSHSNVSVTKRSGEAWKLSSLVSRVRGGIAESVTPEFSFGPSLLPPSCTSGSIQGVSSRVQLNTLMRSQTSTNRCSWMGFVLNKTKKTLYWVWELLNGVES